MYKLDSIPLFWKNHDSLLKVWAGCIFYFTNNVVKIKLLPNESSHIASWLIPKNVFFSSLILSSVLIEQSLGEGTNKFVPRSSNPMSKPLQLPVCSSCSRPIMPNDECVKFYCPNCGYVLIWRDSY